MNADQHHFDPVTGILSRIEFNARFPDVFQQESRNGSSLAVMLIDIDYFKSINDAFGHPRGDAILKQLAEVLQHAVRKTDYLFRYGGDEFIVLMPDTNRDQAHQFAMRVSGTVRLTEFHGDPSLSLTVSTGVAACPEDRTDSAALVKIADDRLLEAKRQGRDRVVSGEMKSDPATLFDRETRLVERDRDSELMEQFLNMLEIKKRGVLVITGQAGAGKSRFLTKVRESARLRGYSRLELTDDPYMRDRDCGVLQAMLEAWYSEFPKCETPADYFAEMADILSRRDIRKLMILVDDLHRVDAGTIEFLHMMLTSAPLPQFGFCFTAFHKGFADIMPLEAPVREIIELRSLSAAGLRVWLRNLMQWEATEEFNHWLYRQSLGLPGNVRKILEYLINRGVLKQSTDHVWILPTRLKSLDLTEKLGLKSQLPPHRLPAFLTNFVGRKEEVTEIGRLLMEFRLLSLIGPGGVGKTRLALKSVSDKLMDFRDGVFFVPLAAITSTDFLISAIASMLKLKFFEGMEPGEQLLNYLMTRRILLVLDNFEHLVSGSGFIAGILESCPEMHILVTSRERLQIHGEKIYTVSGMPVPPADTELEPDQYSSLQLFLQSARYVSLDFEINADNLEHVIRICHLVDGSPLGIELAAPWVTVLSCRQLADEIEKNVDFLATRETNIPDRHRSLRAVFEHSWQLLTDAERTALAQISVFNGGFTIESGLKITGAPMNIIMNLLEKSLIRKTSSVYYFVMKVLHPFIREKLDEMPEIKKDVQESHCRYFASFLETITEEKSTENALGDPLAKIAMEIDNVRDGWMFATTHGMAVEIIPYIDGLTMYCSRNGLFDEGEKLCDKALRMISSDPESGSLEISEKMQFVTAKMYSMRGTFAFGMSRFDAARTYFLEAMDLFEALSEEKEYAFTINGLGGVALRFGDYPGAKKRYEQCLEINRRLGEKQGTASALNNLANIVSSMGDNQEAIVLYEESLEILRELGLERGIATLLTNIGLIAGFLGDHEREYRLFHESFELRKKIGDRNGIAMSLDNIGTIEFARGNNEVARSMLEESREILSEIGDKWALGNVLVHLSNLLTAPNEWKNQRDILKEALTIFREMGDPCGMAVSLLKLGTSLTASGNYQRADEALSEGCAIFRKIGDTHGQSLGLVSYGALHTKQKRFIKAIEEFIQALDLIETIGSVQTGLNTLKSIGILFMDEAMELYEDAYGIFQYLSSRTELHAAYRIDLVNKIGKLRELSVSRQLDIDTHSYEGSLKVVSAKVRERCQAVLSELN